MSTYILLITLSPEGRQQMVDDPERLLHAESEIDIPGVNPFGLYGVLGSYDFVSLVEAPDNESIARFSLEFGARTATHIETLPAVPIALFSQRAPLASDDVGETIAEPG